MRSESGIFYKEYLNEGGDEHPPLVLLHGAGGDHLFWHPELRHIPGINVYALDLPNHRESLAYSYRSVSDLVDPIKRLCQELRIKNAVFAGHSMGGAIALQLAIDLPELTSGLILISTGVTLPVNQKLMEILSNPDSYQDGIKMIVKWSFNPNTSRDLIDQAHKRMSESPQDVTVRDFTVCNKFDLSDSLDKVNPKTLIICGSEDKMTPPSYSQELVQKIPKARLEIIEGAGHMVILEKPDELRVLMRDFICR